MKQRAKISASLFALAASLFAVSPALAWVEEDSRIVKIFNMENGQIFVQTESGRVCHFVASGDAGKALYSSALAAHLSGKKILLTCYDATSSTAGFTAHQLHRIALK